MSSRNFCFTCNNYTDEHINNLRLLFESGLVRYLVYGKEVAPTTLTPHLQGFIVFKKTQRLSGAIKQLFGCHVLVRARNSTNQQAADYCKKDGEYTEYGVLNQQGKRNDLLEIAKKLDAGASLRDVAVSAPDTYIRNYRGIANYKALITNDYTPEGLRGYWFVGAPGSGKSRTARDENPGAYLKAQNKWWDGYAGEKVVILDDLDKGAIGLGHHLKIWADRYAFTGEIKGGIVKTAYDKFIVTSNYFIEDLWKDDKEMCAAINRRFIQRIFPEDLPVFDLGPQMDN
jgi:Putative viral replication protein/RNA helicase